MCAVTKDTNDELKVEELCQGLLELVVVGPQIPVERYARVHLLQEGASTRLARGRLRLRVTRGPAAGQRVYRRERIRRERVLPKRSLLSTEKKPGGMGRVALPCRWAWGRQEG